MDEENLYTQESPEIPYMRISWDYYLIDDDVPTVSGKSITKLIKWNKQAIIDDFGKKYLDKIPKYNGFTCVPSHLNYKQVIGKRFNEYHPISHKPKEGSIEKTYNFLSHIFGEQLPQGLDYLQLLLTKPTQYLPILCLVSNERNTGKSTFLKFLKAFFEANATFIESNSFQSQFNSDWAGKLLGLMDETLFNQEEITEKLKYLSTSNTQKLEAKGKDRIEIYLFIKFIICTNNEDNFIKIDEYSERFWVRKIRPLNSTNSEMLEELIQEIPAFMYYLTKRKLSTRKQSRMWFSFEQIKTKAFTKLVQNNKSRVEKELASILYMIMERIELKEINLCPYDAVSLVSKSRIKTSHTEMRKILKRNWKLTNQNNTSWYEKFTIWPDGDIQSKKAKGRYFTITKKFLIENFDDFDDN